MTAEGEFSLAACGGDPERVRRAVEADLVAAINARARAWDEENAIPAYPFGPARSQKGRGW